jgi:hypothetical protein
MRRRALGAEEIGIDAARPHRQMRKAAIAELLDQRLRGHHCYCRRRMKAAQHGIAP